MTDLWGNPSEPRLVETPPARLTHGERADRAREQARMRERQRWQNGNPLVKTLGPGPDGATCADCAHLLRLRGNATVYLKCEMRGVTHGTGTDHRAKWPACARFLPISARPEVQR